MMVASAAAGLLIGPALGVARAADLGSEHETISVPAPSSDGGPNLGHETVTISIDNNHLLPLCLVLHVASITLGQIVPVTTVCVP